MSHTTDTPPATTGDGRGGSTPTPHTSDLTPSDLRFVREYATHRNITRAYRLSYPHVTYQTARTEGRRLLAKPHIQAELAAVRKDARRMARVSAARVLRELARIAFADAADLHRDDPEADGLPAPLPLSEIDPEARAVIQSVRTKRKRLRAAGPRGDTTQWEVEHAEYVTCDKLRALEMLCRHLGLTKDGAAIEAVLAKIEAVERAENQTTEGGGP